jgi:hypothetical protein
VFVDALALQRIRRHHTKAVTHQINAWHGYTRISAEQWHTAGEPFEQFDQHGRFEEKKNMICMKGTYRCISGYCPAKEALINDNNPV